MLLKLGDTGAAVQALTQDLVTFGLLSATTPIYSADVAKAVSKFQASGLDPMGHPLVIDGQCGPMTKFAIDVTAGRLPTPPVVRGTALTLPQAGGSVSGRAALVIALREMAQGACEVGRDNYGPDIVKYLHGQAAQGASWCAGFVSYCFANSGQPMPFKYTLGAQNVLAQFKAKGWTYNASFQSVPEPGDIIVFTRATKTAPWLGHIGLVQSYADGVVTTVEGNRGPYPSHVNSYKYVLGRIDKLLGFGRALP